MTVGDKVYWIYTTWQQKTIERAGEIFYVVPPKVHPNTIGMGQLVNSKRSARNEESYLVKCQGILFWESRIQPLPEDKKHLMYEQIPLSVNSTPIPIDTSDRIKLKRLLKNLNTEFSETPEYLHIPSWGKRLVFGIQNGQEYLKHIQYI